MDTTAVLMRAPGDISLDTLELRAPNVDEIVVEIAYSGVSAGTERLLWTGRMPPFPGMGYPLVPGYESVGEVVEAGPLAGVPVGTTVFVPGADCYEGARGLFGGAARRIVSRADRAVRLSGAPGPEAALIALAATARHAIAGLDTELPDLIVGHGVMGRLLARLTLAAGGRPPVVWECASERRAGDYPYPVIDPGDDPKRLYRTIYDVSGDGAQLDRLIPRLEKGGEIVLAGFYAEPLSFAFPPAFMKEARLRVAAEWTPSDMQATRLLIEEGHLALDGLISHTAPAAGASAAYKTAFDDPACLKMILNWKGTA
ncbi:MAG: chlorophyll synthesis pathway protein BchC [Pseudomonadota bacterium]